MRKGDEEENEKVFQLAELFSADDFSQEWNPEISERGCLGGENFSVYVFMSNEKEENQKLPSY